VTFAPIPLTHLNQLFSHNRGKHYRRGFRRSDLVGVIIAVVLLVRVQTLGLLLVQLAGFLA
jgi:hypothetical protein